jgi:hypothetical protein
MRFSKIQNSALAHRCKTQNYGPADYMDEFGRLIDAMTNDTDALADYGRSKPNPSLLARASRMLVGPNIVSGYWTPEMVWWAGFPERFKDNLAALAVAQLRRVSPLSPPY